MQKTAFLLLVFLTISVCAKAEAESSRPPRALFVTVLQEPQVLSSREEMDKLISFAKESGIETLFVQIYRANKAWFPSRLADSKPYEFVLKKIGRDPFALLIQKAHEQGIQVHAWMNMLSLSNNGNAKIVETYGNEIFTRNQNWKWLKKQYLIDQQFFLEPGDLRVRKMLSDIVEEVVRAYPDLDGIEFDYLRYPDKHPAYGYTKMNMERFKQAHAQKKIKEGSELWNQWKRDQVTDTLKVFIERARSVRPKIQISTTGLMPYSRAHLEGFQDWKFWVNSGLVDFVTLMCYHRDTAVFQSYLADAKKQARDFKQINIAVGAYAQLKQPEKFHEQFQLCEASNPLACVVFHYGSLVENPRLAEPMV